MEGKWAEREAKLREEFESESEKRKRKEHDQKVRHYKAYTLKKDIMGKPKKDGTVKVSHKAGGVYFQNPMGTATVQFLYTIGDKEYFDRCPEKDYTRTDAIYKLSPVGD